jgi:hypothetical protein
LTGRQALTGQALVHGYDTAFWWTAGIFAVGATPPPRGTIRDNLRLGSPAPSDASLHSALDTVQADWVRGRAGLPAIAPAGT